MIATHNIKVNGRWIRAGERYGEPEAGKAPAKSLKQEPKAEPAPAEAMKAEEEPKAEVKAEPKPRSATRRKTTK